MSNEHGGRRIKICVYEYAYPHSESAKKCGRGQEFPLCTLDYHRPANACSEFVIEMFNKKVIDKFSFTSMLVDLLDKNLVGDATLIQAVGRHHWHIMEKNLEKKPVMVKETTKSSLTSQDSL